MRLYPFLLLLASFSAFASPVKTEHVTAEIISDGKFVRPGTPATIGLKLTMIPHWHTYWEFPGDSGLPTKVQWKLPGGWKTGAPQWEIPERIIVPPLVNFGYSGETVIGFQLDVPSGTKDGDYEISAAASWLVCKEECIPEKAELRFIITVKDNPPFEPPLDMPFEKVAFMRLRNQQPRPAPEGKHFTVVKEAKRIGLVAGDEDLKWLGSKPDFFPLEAGVVSGQKAPKREGNILWMEKAEPFNEKAGSLKGILVVNEKSQIPGRGFDRVAYRVDEGFPGAAVAPSLGEEGEPGLALAIVFAFLGGLLLNLMPCVFPVLGIKVMGMLENGAGNPWRARLHGKIYALGVLVSFWILTAVLLLLRRAGESVGWGFQLQEPGVVIALAFLFLFLAGNLGGFFELGGRWMGLGSRLAEKEGWLGSFFTGVLAVVVATPCSAPFMGSAIGLVLSQPAWAVFSVFTALGAGLAAPFVLLAYWPALLRVLPRPGMWMVRMKEFFAFPMLATMLWLLWVLGQQRGLDAAIIAAGGLLLLSLAAWVQHYFKSAAAKFVALLLAILALLVGFSPLKMKPAAAGISASSEAWRPYSESALTEALNSGKAVFVDFTAAWCLTCQVNKKLVLDREAIQNYFREKEVVLLLADWTNHSPEITAALARHNRIGVPLYLGYPRGSKQAKVLPQILTDDIIRQAFP